MQFNLFLVSLYLKVNTHQNYIYLITCVWSQFGFCVNSYISWIQFKTCLVHVPWLPHLHKLKGLLHVHEYFKEECIKTEFNRMVQLVELWTNNYYCSITWIVWSWICPGSNILKQSTQCLVVIQFIHFAICKCYLLHVW